MPEAALRPQTPSAATLTRAGATVQRRRWRTGEALRRRLAYGALACAVGTTALIAAAAAGHATSLVPHAGRAFPAWLAGPLHPLGLELPTRAVELLLVLLTIAYLLIVRVAATLSARALWTAIVLAHLAVALAPPLLSADVFGYLGFARLEVLHGLNPYLATANAAPRDAIFPLLGWHGQTTPYGPLFTILSFALVPLGIAGGLWALKLLAALASIATLVLLVRVARLLGRSPHAALAFLGLNPLVLVFAVGGAHIDVLVGLALTAAALAVLAEREELGGAAVIVAVALKLSAVLIAPFALIGSRRRGRMTLGALVALLVVLAASLVVFGGELGGMANALLTEQRQIAGSAIPSKVSRLLGLGRLAPGVRVAFLAMFLAVLLWSLRRAWRGAAWLDAYGWTTLALLVSSAWLLPWYGLWALLPASLSESRRLRLATLVLSVYLVMTRIAAAHPLSSG